jgi:hypothetical protein
MKWVIKAAVQKVFGSLPARVADPMYHGIQHLTRGIPIEVQDQRSFIEEVASVLNDIRGKSLSGLRIVELGSGWYPVLPLLLICEFGALSVDTFDVNQHYSPVRIAAAASEIMNVVVHLRGDSVLQQTARSGCLPDSIHYHPRSEVQAVSEIRGGLADLALSRLVLPNITPEGIREIHFRSRQWLTQDAIWIHILNTGDERAREDSTLHPFDFLKYSEKEWMRRSGNRYAYTNRLRLPQYRSLFESAGWNVEREVASVSKSAIETLNRVPIHADFQCFSPEALSASSIRFALVRSAARHNEFETNSQGIS